MLNSTASPTDAEARAGATESWGGAPGMESLHSASKHPHISPHEPKTWNRDNYQITAITPPMPACTCKCTHTNPTHPIARSKPDFAPLSSRPWIPSNKKRKDARNEHHHIAPKEKKKEDGGRSPRCLLRCRPNFLTPSRHHLAVSCHQTPVPASPRRHRPCHHPMRHGQRASPRDDRATSLRQG